MTDPVEGEKPIIFKTIGNASTWFCRKNGTPRQPSVSSLTRGSIKINKNIFSNPEHSLENLDQFSHVWVLFLFHKNAGECTKAKVAPPRLNGARVGVFSTRSPHRPNPVGLTLARIDKVEGDTIHLSGLDLLDTTPIIDIKPYIPAYDSPQAVKEDQCTGTPSVTSPTWTTLKNDEKTLKVVFTDSALQQIGRFSSDAPDHAYRLRFLKSAEEAIRAIRDILSEDPRSVYRKNKCQDRLYFCIVDEMHVTSWFDEMENKCEVLRVMPLSIRQAANLEAEASASTSDNQEDATTH